MNELSNKIALVTGSTAGLGKAIAISLAGKGAKVIITSRDQNTGDATLSEIKNRTNNQNTDLLVVDFSSQRSIREAVDKFKSKYSQLHLLVNCASIFKQKRGLTVDGLESMFAVNQLGYFLLTNLLLDLLKSSAPSRILNITAPSTTKLDFEDLQSEKKFNALRAFGASKMANLLFSFALARRLQGTKVTANAIHPGLMKTTLMREAAAPLRWFLNLVSQSPEKASKSVVEVAVSDQFGEQSGKFYTKAREIKSAEYAQDQKVQDQLWEACAKLTKLN